MKQSIKNRKLNTKSKKSIKNRHIKSKKTTKKNRKNRNIRKIRKIRKTVSGGRIKTLAAGGKSSLGKVLKKTKKSEKKLIESFQKHSKATDTYYVKLNEHVNNLQELDEHIPEVTSFVNIFNNTVMPEDIVPNKKIDKSVPLFIQSYGITEYSSPKEITKEHVKQQVRYVIKKNHAPHESRLLRDMEVDLDPNTVNVRFVLLDNRTTASHSLSHENYELNLVELGLKIKDVIEDAKAGVEYKESKDEKQIKQNVSNLYQLNKRKMRNIEKLELAQKPGQQLGQQPGQQLGVAGQFGVGEQEISPLDIERREQLEKQLQGLAGEEQPLENTDLKEDSDQTENQTEEEQNEGYKL